MVASGPYRKEGPMPASLIDFLTVVDVLVFFGVPLVLMIYVLVRERANRHHP